MNQATPSSGGSVAPACWRILVVVGCLVLAAAAWVLPPGAEASQAGPASAQQVPTSSTSSTIQATTTTTQPTTTQPPVTDPPVTEPPVTEPPPEPEVTTPDPDESEEDPEPSVPTTGPLPTTANLLVEGDGTSSQAQATTTTTSPGDDGGGSSSDDRRRLIWMIIAGLAGVALLVALLTWRYWLLTRPGLDLSDDDPGDDEFGPGPQPDRLARHSPAHEWPDRRASAAAVGPWAPPSGPGDGSMTAPALPPPQAGPWPDPQGARDPRDLHDLGTAAVGGRNALPDGEASRDHRAPPGGQAFVDAPGPTEGRSPDPGLGRGGAGTPGGLAGGDPRLRGLEGFAEPPFPAPYPDAAPGPGPRGGEPVDMPGGRGSRRGRERDLVGWAEGGYDQPSREGDRRPRNGPDDAINGWPDPQGPPSRRH